MKKVSIAFWVILAAAPAFAQPSAEMKWFPLERKAPAYPLRQADSGNFRPLPRARAAQLPVAVKPSKPAPAASPLQAQMIREIFGE